MASDRFQILSISGGGMRGVFSAYLIELLEQYLCRSSRFLDHFDFVTGTSVGGIITLGLAAGLDTARVRSALEREGPKIFANGKGFARNVFWAKYRLENLTGSINSILPNRDIKLGDIGPPKVLVPAVSLDTGKVKLFCNYKDEDRNRRVAEVAVATAAAPTYFPTAVVGNGAYVDGGIVANSPELLGIGEAIKHFGVAMQRIHVLSVGTMGRPFGLAHRGSQNLGFRGWGYGKTLLDLTLYAQQAVVQEVCLNMIGDRYLRIDREPTAEQSKILGLDSAKREALKTLKALAEAEVTKWKSRQELLLFFTKARVPGGP